MEISPFADDAMLSNFYFHKRRSPIAYGRAMLRRMHLLRSAEQFDLLWVEKELFPYFPAFGEKWLNRRRVSYVVDYDDAVFHNYDRHKSFLIRYLLHSKIAEVMRFSACVLAGNNYLAEYARAAGATRIEHIPTVVSTDRYFPITHTPSKEIRVGWIGTPATTHYLGILREIIPLLGTERRFRFTLIGASREKLSDLPVDFASWSEETEVKQIQQLDIGIMPLVDGPGERGKCGYKLIQYMACGLPVIASPVGVNREIVQNGVNGFLASSPQEWAAALRKLAAEPLLRTQMGAAGREHVEMNYSTQVVGPKLITILQSLVRAEGSGSGNQRNGGGGGSFGPSACTERRNDYDARVVPH
jgi:glycosyltransferase involved in cell wall biosynthesis